MDGEEARQCRMDCGFCIVCVPSSTLRQAFNVRSSEGRRVCTVGLGKTFQISFQAGSFFPFVPIDIHEPVRPAAKCGTSTRDGLIERCVWPTFSILFRGGFLVSRIFIAHRAIRVSFPSHVPHLYERRLFSSAYLSTFSPAPSARASREKADPIKKRIRRYRRERTSTT